MRLTIKPQYFILFYPKNKNYILVILLATINIFNIQSQSFAISKTGFSTSATDDFAPVFYKQGLVYCSNALNKSLVSIKSENEGLFNMLYVQPRDSGEWRTPELFSEELTTILNEGPAAFTPDDKTIYYARNLQTEGKLRQINDPSNTLGIYTAQLTDGRWTNITGFEYNSSSYSVGTPALSPDAKQLYFASDKPGGYGGTDLYCCEWDNNHWGEPVNLGPEINSGYNESYPFINGSGRLFFASDKPGGKGGKDIYYSVKNKGKWIKPIHLDEEINSSADDYGLIVDKNFEKGYFSSARKGSTNIYAFKTIVPQFDLCERQQTFSPCFYFFDEQFKDTLHLEYVWDFGYGIKKNGLKIKQCFQKPGEYTAVLTIIHHLADSIISTKSLYPFEIQPNEDQAIITDPDAIVHKPIKINARIKDTNHVYRTCIWDFGEGFSFTGNEIQHTFDNAGEHLIRLGIIERNDSMVLLHKKCVEMPLYVFSDYEQLAVSRYNSISQELLVPNQQNNIKHKAENELDSYALHSYLLAKLAPLKSDSISSFLISVSNSRLVFDSSEEANRDTQNILTRFAMLLLKNPGLRLEVYVHQEPKGTSRNNEIETQNVASAILSYFNNNGISYPAIICRGYGDSRPLVQGNSKEAELKDKRIEFILLNQE